MITRTFFDTVAWYVKRTPPHPGRGVLARLAYRLDPHDIVHEMAPGVRVNIRIDCDEDLAYWTNRYEQHDDVRVFTSLLRPGMTVVDVGANIGMYALMAARAVGSHGRVVAFEPVPAVYQRLVANLEVSEVDNVWAHPVALSDHAGTATFYLGRTDSMGSLYRAQTSDAIEVTTDTLDDFVARHGVDRVDAVKIDAEGAEPSIVRGMRGILGRADRPLLLVEHNYGALRAAGSSAEELFATIIGYGYAPHLVTGGRLEPVQDMVEPFKAGDEAYANYVFLPLSPRA